MSTVTILGPFDQGDLVKIDVEFTDSKTGAAVDPSPLTCDVVIVSLSNTPTTYTYGTSSNFIKNATGSYTLAVDTTPSGGRYKWRFKTPNGNAYQFSEQGEFTVIDDTL